MVQSAEGGCQCQIRGRHKTEKSKARQIVVTQDVTSPATSELGHDRQHPLRLLLRLQPDLSSELAVASYLFYLYPELQPAASRAQRLTTFLNSSGMGQLSEANGSS